MDRNWIRFSVSLVRHGHHSPRACEQPAPVGPYPPLPILHRIGRPPPARPEPPRARPPVRPRSTGRRWTPRRPPWPPTIPSNPRIRSRPSVAASIRRARIVAAVQRIGRLVERFLVVLRQLLFGRVAGGQKAGQVPARRRLRQAFVLQRRILRPRADEVDPQGVAEVAAHGDAVGRRVRGEGGHGGAGRPSFEGRSPPARTTEASLNRMWGGSHMVTGAVGMIRREP